MTRNPRVGYVGLDHAHAEQYLASLSELPVTVSAACEPNQDFDTRAVSGLPDIPVYETPTQLLDEASVEVLWLTLSNRETPEVIETAARRGVDVFTEKPVAKTSADLRSIQSTVSDSDITVGVSYLWRGFPPALELRERAHTGFFGDVRAIDIRYVASQLSFRDTDHYLYDAGASRGGIVQWLGVHFLDLVPWILDDPIDRVNGTLHDHTAEVDVEDGGSIQFETASGARGSLLTGYYLPDGRYDTRIGIYGSTGYCDWDPMGEEFNFDNATTLELESIEPSSGASRRTLTYDYDSKPGYGGASGLSYMRTFLESRRQDTEGLPATLEDAVAVLSVLDAVYESARTDGWVSVDYGET